MAISIGYNGSTLLKPGSYSKTDVELNGGNPLSPAGILGIVGEALGGAPGTTDGVQSFTSVQLFDIIQKYVSGPIVDAARLAFTPSKDPDILNGANILRVYKTNSGTQATAGLVNIDDAPGPDTQFNLTSANYGLDENNINLYITEGTAVDEHTPFISDVITFPFNPTPGGTIVYSFAGVDYTFTTPGGGPFADVAATIALLNNAGNWAPSKPIVATAVGATKIKLSANTAIAPWDGFEGEHDYGLAFLGGLVGDEEFKFRKRVLLATDGTVGGTFTVVSATGLSIGMWTQVIDDDSAAVFVKISNITGAGPFTVTCKTLQGATVSLAAYTVAQNARILGNCSVVTPSSLAQTAGNGGFSRGQRGTRIFFVKKNTTLETLPENPNADIFRILYVGAGSACAMTIQDVGGTKKLTTVCTGDAPGNLNITLSTYTTIQQLVDFINNFGAGAKYLCVSDYFNAGTLSPQKLDYYNAIDIAHFPLSVKSNMADIVGGINANSQLITASEVSNVYGQLALVASTNRKFLSGAVNGATANSSVQSGFDALLNVDCNTVVPLFSRDAAADISDGLTDASSTYTIASINAIADSHCRIASSTINRSERDCYIALKDTFTNTKLAARLMNSEYASLALEDVLVLNSAGNAVWMNPQMFAVVAAGMQCGAEIGLPLTRKAMNVLDIRHATFNPRTQYGDAITNGILFAEKPDKGGVVVVVGNTTYQKDGSFVFNRKSVLTAAHYTARYLREGLESAFVGKTKAGGTTLAQGVKSYAQTLLGVLLRNNILVADAKNQGLGYRNLTVSVLANVVTLSVIITPVEGIDFVLENITLAAINDNA